VGVVAIIAGGKTAEVFQFIEAAFDAITVLIEMLTVFAGSSGIGTRWNDRLYTASLQMAAQGFANITFVSQKSLGFQATYKIAGFCNISSIPAGEPGTYRQSFFIGGQMDFGRQSSLGSPHSLIAEPPFPAFDC